MISQKIVKTEHAEFAGISVEIIAGGDHAPFTIMKLTVAPNTGSPSHISYDEDKVFLVTSGSFRFHIGDEFFDVNAGEQVSVAKGATHGFFNMATTPACQTLIASPAQHDRFMQALNALPDQTAQNDIEDVCGRYNQKVVDHPKTS